VRQYFIYGLISGLVLTGLIAIFAVLSGSFSEIQAKIMITTVSVFFYSIVALCCNILLEGKYDSFGKIGIAVAVIGFLVATVNTWTAGYNDGFIASLRLRGVADFLAIAFAHASLMLYIKPRNAIVSLAVWTALACNVIFTLIVISQILSAGIWTTGLGAIVQLQVTLCIVSVVATITAPLVNRFS